MFKDNPNMPEQARAAMALSQSIDTPNLSTVIEMLEDMRRTFENEACRAEYLVERIVPQTTLTSGANSKAEHPRPESNNLHRRLSQIVDDMRIAGGRLIGAQNRLQEYIGE